MMEPEYKMPTYDLDRQKAVEHQTLTLQRDAEHSTDPNLNPAHYPFAQRVFEMHDGLGVRVLVPYIRRALYTRGSSQNGETSKSIM